MRVPLEVLRLILREMTEVFSVPELLRARLVDPIFASEILPLVLDSPRAAEKDFIYEHWSRFPNKHRFIRHRIHQHHQQPCFFSEFVHEILQIPSISQLSEQEKDVLITKLIDVITFSRNEPRGLFSPRRRLEFSMETYRKEVAGSHNMWEIIDKPMEPIEETLHVALTASAIIRNDVAELNRINTPAGPNFITKDNLLLGLLPLEIATRVGSKEIISAIAAREYPMLFRYRAFDYREPRTFPCMGIDPRRPFIVAARCANRDFFEAWLEWTKDQRTYDDQVVLNAAVRSAIRTRNMDMVEYLGSLCESLVTFPAILYDAIGTGDIEILRWCSRQRDFRVYGSGPYKGPLWVALHDCPRATRPAVLETLLDLGFDPNDVDPENRESLLQYAIRIQDVESVRLLVQYGADVNVDSSTSAWLEKQKSPLALAVFRSPVIMQLLLQREVIRRWSWRGKEHFYRIDPKGIEHIEGVFKDLGFDEQQVQDEHAEGYIIVNG